MGISLFKHNKVAYDAALSMLRDCGKAAIVHPTGTGKSFIGFKLCEDFPESVVCWLSPSEYIFKTQIENLKAVSDGYAPENVKFFTYAKLMNMSEAELSEIAPDYIVLDEFHRCGAEMWGQGVDNLLKIYPNAPVLGLSATAVRYLDNQRDMAGELFDGNVASKMTLGEAIVRGILNPPKYVLSVFSYQNDLEKYEKRVRFAKNKAVRDAGEEYLEALRHALAKADGMDEIFAKHMEERTGKYIVFCANYEHMHEMIELAPEWFAKVDAKPHIYTAYSDDPETSKAFADFKADVSGHLKLLYCIDMLNEGVHVEDVSGVILLRPTVSPIIYKQQIGRALSASKKTNAVIFDIVLNIENLYSIGAVEEEMQVALSYYRSLGMGEEIVNENFRVVDEVRDCIELFDKLNDTLTASWDLMFAAAKRYHDENGDLNVPKRYVTEHGLALGSWLNTQRLVRSGKAMGLLTGEQIEKLNSIGMRWESVRDLSWERNFAAAKEYYEEHGDLLVPVGDTKYHGVPLGRWLAGLRSYRKNNAQSAYLTQERIDALDGIGMVWDVPDYLWEKNYHAALEYHRENGNLGVPTYYVTEDGLRLGAWLVGLRKTKAELSAEQISRLDALGFSWTVKSNNTWEQSYAAACEYKRAHGDLDVPVSYVTEDGCKLGRWLRRQRDKQSELSEVKKQKLDAIGMIWDSTDPWEEKMRLVEAYYAEHGDVNIPADYVVDGVWLARWLSEQVARFNGKPTGRNKTVNPLTKEQCARIEALGIKKNVSRNDLAWEEQYLEAKAYYEENGDLAMSKRYVSPSGKNLGVWVQRQRLLRRDGKLKAEQIAKLDDIGMVWETKSTSSKISLAHISQKTTRNLPT
ncbi:MAG: Helicase associated domain protein [Clostridia bacterium]|nr:Helicase associated domain protein [Clostridia bacterium]